MIYLATCSCGRQMPSTCRLCEFCDAERKDMAVRAFHRAPAFSGTPTPAVVRQADAIVTGINRREARLARSRRRRFVAGRVTGFVLIGMGAFGLLWGAYLLCMNAASALLAWIGGIR